MRVPVLQNEDSLCSLREFHTSNTASTPNISGVCTGTAVDSASARGSVLIITYYGSSDRMIPAAFHGCTLTGMRVPVLQNEDSSCSIKQCNTSNTASTPNISDVGTAADVGTACARGSVLLITNWYTSMST